MLNREEILQTQEMIDHQHLDVRTITMGISLTDCAHPDIDIFCRNIYDKITRYAQNLVRTGEQIEAEYGIPIVNKRISVTPISIVAAACKTDSFVPVAQALDRAAREVGVNFLGRLFRPGAQRLYPCGHSTDAVHSRSAGPPPGWCVPLSTWRPPAPASTWTRWLWLAGS